MSVFTFYAIIGGIRDGGQLRFIGAPLPACAIAGCEGDGYYLARKVMQFDREIYIRVGDHYEAKDVQP